MFKDDISAAAEPEASNSGISSIDVSDYVPVSWKISIFDPIKSNWKETNACAYSQRLNKVKIAGVGPTSKIYEYKLQHVKLVENVQEEGHKAMSEILFNLVYQQQGSQCISESTGKVSPPEERRKQLIEEINELNEQAKQLENDGDLKLGLLSMPLSLTTLPAASSALSSEGNALGEAKYYLRGYDEHGVSVHEKLLQCQMKHVALTRLCEGELSAEFVDAKISLAETYARMALWRQAFQHGSDSIGTLSKLDNHETQKNQSTSEDTPSSRSTKANPSTAKSKSPMAKSVNSSSNKTMFNELQRMKSFLSNTKPHSTTSSETLFLNMMAENSDFERFMLSSNAFKSLCSRKKFHAITAAIDESPSRVFQWEELVQYLQENDAPFQTYIQRIEAVIPVQILNQLRDIYSRSKTSSDGSRSATTRLIDGLQQNVVSEQQHSRGGEEQESFKKLHNTLQRMLQEGVKGLSWGEFAEIAKGSMSVSVRMLLRPRVMLLLGRCYANESNLEKAESLLRNAVCEQEAMVGQEDVHTAEYYQSLAECLALRQKEEEMKGTEKAKQQALTWLTTAEGARHLRRKTEEMLRERVSRENFSEDVSKEVLTRIRRDAEKSAKKVLVEKKSELHLEMPTQNMLHEAKELFIKVRKIREVCEGQYSVQVAQAYTAYGNLLILFDELEEAQVYLCRAVEIYQMLNHAQQQDTSSQETNSVHKSGTIAMALLQLHVGRLLRSQKQYQNASKHLFEAGDYLYERSTQVPEWLSAISRQQLACKALEAYRLCLKGTLSSAAPNYSIPQRTKADVLERISKAVDIGYGEYSVEAAAAMKEHGTYLAKQQRFKEAKKVLQNALHIHEMQFGGHDRRVKRIQKELKAVQGRISSESGRTKHTEDASQSEDDKINSTRQTSSC